MSGMIFLLACGILLILFLVSQRRKQVEKEEVTRPIKEPVKEPVIVPIKDDDIIPIIITKIARYDDGINYDEGAKYE
jgi:hypothetical protein